MVDRVCIYRATYATACTLLKKAIGSLVKRKKSAIMSGDRERRREERRDSGSSDEDERMREESPLPGDVPAPAAAPEGIMSCSTEKMKARWGILVTSDS